MRGHLRPSRDESHVRVERIRKWTLGDYEVMTGNQIVKVSLQAGIGVVQWDSSESGAALLARADADLYVLKPGRESPAGSRPGSGLSAAKR